MDKLQGINKNNRSTLKEGPIENNFARISEVEPILNKVNEIVDIENKKPKVYKALLTQTGTNAPVATVLENTLGGSIVWSYISVGEYLGTLNGAFTDNKVFILNTQKSVGGDRAVNVFRENNNSVKVITARISTGLTQNDILVGDSVLIEVYP